MLECELDLYVIFFKLKKQYVNQY